MFYFMTYWKIKYCVIHNLKQGTKCPHGATLLVSSLHSYVCYCYSF